jgi:hypothetical protein
MPHNKMVIMLCSAAYEYRIERSQVLRVASVDSRAQHGSASGEQHMHTSIRTINVQKVEHFNYVPEYNHRGWLCLYSPLSHRVAEGLSSSFAVVKLVLAAAFCC